MKKMLFLLFGLVVALTMNAQDGAHQHRIVMQLTSGD